MWRDVATCRTECWRDEGKPGTLVGVQFPNMRIGFLALQQYQGKCSLSNVWIAQRYLSEPLNLRECTVALVQCDE